MTALNYPSHVINYFPVVCIEYFICRGISEAIKRPCKTFQVDFFQEVGGIPEGTAILF